MLPEFISVSTWIVSESNIHRDRSFTSVVKIFAEERSCLTKSKIDPTGLEVG